MMLKKMRHLFFMVATTFFFSCGDVRGDAQSPLGENIYKNVVFVDSSGAEHTIQKKFPGKNVLVVAYAIWCKFCQDEIPFLKNLQEKMGDNLEIVVINIDASNPVQGRDDAEKPVIYSSTTQNSLQEAMDKNGISGIPAAFLFTKDGELVLMETGLKEWDSEKSIEELKEKLNIAG